ncbi:SGNH/GDSL hydrolase family protein [Compostibacter hankyongensis]|uniref:SGNH/GDSL hydrolase family protein n=1 Tax=Compostibacter hankyongensis TaxID=1007089 RepID=A0ABP8FMQ9_9BACT
MKKIILLTLVILSAAIIRLTAQDVRPFQKGDRIVFEGNSITHGGHYHSYVWLYYMTHFPDRRIEIFNCGIGGDVAGGMYKRLDSDVFSKHPTVIVLTFGMNDAGYYEYLQPDAKAQADKKVQQSYDDYQKIEKRLLAYTPAQKIMLTSPPFDETAKVKSPVFPGKNAAMLRIADFQEASAKKHGWGFIDLSRPMTAINEREQQRDSTFTLQGQGRIHPDNDGHLVMAYLILKKQGLAGKDVANVHIDAGNGKISRSDNCRISNLSATPAGIRFDYLANSLPFPIDTLVRGWGEIKAQSDALPYIPFMKEFDNERLAVAGLKSGSYVLKMDGEKIGTWSAEELAGGINLAEQRNTPEYRQALAIMTLNETRWEIEKKFRDYYWMEYSFLQDKGLLFHDDVAALDTIREAARENIFVRGNMQAYIEGHFKSVREAWKGEMKLLTDKIYAINKPVSHRVEITPARRPPFP